MLIRINSEDYGLEAINLYDVSLFVESSLSIDGMCESLALNPHFWPISVIFEQIFRFRKDKTDKD